MDQCPGPESIGRGLQQSVGGEATAAYVETVLVGNGEVERMQPYVQAEASGQRKRLTNE